MKEDHQTRLPFVPGGLAALVACAAGASVLGQCPPGPMVSLFPTGATSFHEVGYAVAMDSLPDGTLLALSADVFFGSGSTLFGGAGFIFRGDPDGMGGYTWSQEAMLRASDVTSFDISADAVALDASSAVPIAVLGSQKEDSGFTDAGSAGVFARGPDGSWTEEVILVAPDGGAFDYFGSAVAVHQGVAVIGAREGVVGSSRCGTGYIFVRTAETNGPSWEFVQKVSAPDASGGSRFGYSVSCWGDWFVVGAPHDDQMGSNSGAAYVFRRTGPSTWEMHVKLTAPDALAHDEFGWTVSIHDGLLLVGAPSGGVGDIGSAYVFRRDETETGWNWSFEGLLTPTAGQAMGGDRFGETVSIRDGMALIGAHSEDNPGTDAGSAYLFRRGMGGAWSQASKIRLPMPQATDDFGWSVSLARGWALIGCPAHSQYGVNWGNTFVLPAPTSPLIVGPPSDVGVDPGETIALSVEASGRGPWSFQWFKGDDALMDGGRVMGATTDELTIMDAETDDTGIYRVEVSNDCGTSEASAFVSVVPPVGCVGDATSDGQVNFADVTAILASFGMVYTPGTGPGDADGNGVVNFADVTSVLTNWGLPCPH